MRYKLKFTPISWKAWQKLDKSIQTQLKKKLNGRLQNPRVLADKLRGFASVYKIKQRAFGYRLVYKILDEEITVLVVAVGKQNHDDVYKKAAERRLRQT